MTKQLIINADDFGLTPSVSDGIISAHKNGIVQSTTVLINIADPESLKALVECRSLGTGLHLALTIGPGSLPPGKIPNLVDSNGNFQKRKTEYRQIDDQGVVSFENVSKEEIAAEFESQVEKFLDCGLILSHFDSHHHVHANLKVLDTIIYLAGKFSVPVRSIDMRMRQTLRNQCINTSDNFEGRFFGEESVNKESFRSIIANLPDGVTELMCHPGLISPELEQISGYVSERKSELDVLTNPEIKDILEEYNVELMSWSGL